MMMSVEQSLECLAGEIEVKSKSKAIPLTGCGGI
jgi:hypothetical protein